MTYAWRSARRDGYPRHIAALRAVCDLFAGARLGARRCAW